MCLPIYTQDKSHTIAAKHIRSFGTCIWLLFWALFFNYELGMKKDIIVKRIDEIAWRINEIIKRTNGIAWRISEIIKRIHRIANSIDEIDKRGNR